MLEYNNTAESRTYYVIFDRRQGSPRLWNLFTRKGFDHVFLITATSCDTTLAILPTPSGCYIEEWADPVQDILALFHHCTAWIHYTTKPGRTDIWCPRGFITCVTLVKSILGIKGWALTPYALYKQLTKE